MEAEAHPRTTSSETARAKRSDNPMTRGTKMIDNRRRDDIEMQIKDDGTERLPKAADDLERWASNPLMA